MNMALWQRGDYTAELAGCRLHLTEFQLTGSCALREQGTADGSAGVAAFWNKSARLVLRGKLASAADRTEALLALDAAVRQGGTVTVRLGDVVYAEARLLSYTLREGAQLPELVLTAAAFSAPERADV